MLLMAVSKAVIEPEKLKDVPTVVPVIPVVVTKFNVPLVLDTSTNKDAGLSVSPSENPPMVVADPLVTLKEALPLM
jgi:hypothetical protein